MHSLSKEPGFVASYLDLYYSPKLLYIYNIGAEQHCYLMSRLFQFTIFSLTWVTLQWIQPHKRTIHLGLGLRSISSTGISMHARGATAEITSLCPLSTSALYFSTREIVYHFARSIQCTAHKSRSSWSSYLSWLFPLPLRYAQFYSCVIQRIPFSVSTFCRFS